MIPIRDDNPQLKVPVVTYTLIGLNLLAWVLLQGYGQGNQFGISICELGLIPADLLSNFPAAPPSQSLPCGLSGDPNWTTVVSSMFMHGGWMHLAGNLWFLWIFGDNVEDSMGPIRFAVFYLLCGIAAAAAQILADPYSIVPMVGASGAIGGVMGAYIVLYPRVHVHLFFYVTTLAVPAFFMLGYWVLVQLLGGFQAVGGSGGGVAFWAHIGGFAAGATLIYLFKNNELLAAHPYHGWNQKQHRTRVFRSVDKSRDRFR